MRIIWYIYGDVFAHHPTIQFGKDFINNPTPLEWNKPTKAGSYPNAELDNPIGMSDNTPGWENRRVIDFGSNDGWSTQPQDFYIGDDVGTNYGHIQLLLHGNEGEPVGPMSLDYRNSKHWFSTNPGHNSYSSSYKNSDPALYLSATMKSSSAWRSAYAAKYSTTSDFAIYKMQIITSVSKSSSVFISNTTGTGQTPQQRFSRAIKYDPNDAAHATAGTLSNQSSYAANIKGPVGFIQNGTDIGQEFVAGPWAHSCGDYNVIVKWDDIYDVKLNEIYGSSYGTTLTGFKSQNWTDYHHYLSIRQDLVNHQNNGGSYNIPSHVSSQSCTNLGPTTPSKDIQSETFAWLHAENFGLTRESITRTYGSDLNMIIPNPPDGAVGNGRRFTQIRSPGTTVPDMCPDTVKSAFFDEETYLLIFMDTIGLSYWSAQINNQLTLLRNHLRDTVWFGDQTLTDRMMHVIPQNNTKIGTTTRDRQKQYIKILSEANAEFYDPLAPMLPDQKLAIVILQNYAYRKLSSRSAGVYHTEDTVLGGKAPNPDSTEEPINTREVSASQMHESVKVHKRNFIRMHRDSRNSDHCHYLVIGPQHRNAWGSGPATTVQVFKQHLNYMYSREHHCDASTWGHRDTYRDPSTDWTGRMQDYNFSYCVGDPYYIDTRYTATNRDAFRDNKLYDAILGWIGVPR